MLGFAISVNGKQICVASADAVLTATVTCTYHQSDDILFRVGGIAADDLQQHLDWKMPTIGVGDEVTIRLVDSVESNPPPERFYPVEESPEIKR